MSSLRSRPIPKLQDIDLRLLRVFVSVAQNRGFSAAQTELNIGQSTISGYITKLEDRLSVKLCMRGRSGFRLTQAGEALYEAALDLFGDLESFRLKVAEARDDLTGHFYLGTVDSVPQVRGGVIPQMLGKMVEKAPNLHLDVRLGSPHELVRDLVAKRFSAVVLPVFRPLAGLKVVELEDKNMQVLFCARGHPLYGKTPTEEELRAAPFTDRAHMEGWAPYYNRGLNVASTTVDIECQLLLILSGKFIGYLPERDMTQYIAAGDLWPLHHPKMDYLSRICLAVRADDETRATEIFTNLAVELTGNPLLCEA